MKLRKGKNKKANNKKSCDQIEDFSWLDMGMNATAIELCQKRLGVRKKKDT